MARVLYISYTSLTEPLAQGQVLEYLLGLSANHAVSLFTFERRLDDGGEEVERLESVCRSAGIRWERVARWRGPFGLFRPGVFLLAVLRCLRIARSNKIQVLHCRGYISCLVGMCVKVFGSGKLLFDMRGFWPDERVDGGIWRRDGVLFGVMKRLERRLLLGADHVVTLTRSGQRELNKLGYLEDSGPPISVIPTCTNLRRFTAGKSWPGPFTLGYVGSVGSWYCFDEVAIAVAALFRMDSDACFLVVNKGGHEVIRRKLIRAGVDLARVQLVESDFDGVPDLIYRMSAGVFFIKPAWSKRASCPTRMGEFLASGKPCLANDGVGDVKEDLEEFAVGVVAPVTSSGDIDLSDLDDLLLRLRSLCSDEGVSRRSRELAERRFSLSEGVAAYSRIYDSLTSGI